jgi:hypothetical protein
LSNCEGFGILSLILCFLEWCIHVARMLLDIVASNLLVNMFVLACCVRLNLVVCAQLV